MSLLSEILGMPIIHSEFMPIAGHWIDLPTMQVRGDRRRLKRWVRKVRASARPIQTMYLISTPRFEDDLLDLYFKPQRQQIYDHFMVKSGLLGGFKTQVGNHG